MKTQRNDVPRPTEAVLAPWSVPQMSVIISWMEKTPIRIPRCPRHEEDKPKMTLRFEGFVCDKPGCLFTQNWAAPDAFLCPEQRETPEEMKARVDEWNACWPDGTPVSYDPDGPEQTFRKTHTRSRAFLHSRIGPAVHLYKIKGAVPLEYATPCVDRKAKSPEDIERECARA